MKKEINELN